MASLSSSSLYPVVQDLTEVEYGCCCGDDEALGQFSLRDFALPINTPLDSYKKQSSSNEDLGAPKHHHSRSFSFGMKPRRRTSSCNSDGALIDISDSQTVTTESEDRPKFNDVYVLTRQIFLCNQSEVWECVHRESGLRYCVKIIDTNKLDAGEDGKAARREIAFLQAFQGHKSIVRLREALEEGGRYHIVMELEATNLLSRVVQEGGLPEATIRKIARSLLLGLKHIHESNLSHNDLQPSNILLDGADRAKIADFGSASRFDTPPNEPKELSAYVAPEVLQGLPCNSFSDMWSVGVILYFCFFGHAPFMEQSSSRSLLRNHKLDFSFPKDGCNPVSRYAKQLISNCLHNDPSVRLTAEEALEHHWLVDEVGTHPKQNGRPIRKCLASFFEKVLCIKKKRPRPATLCCTSTSSSSRDYI